MTKFAVCSEGTASGKREKGDRKKGTDLFFRKTEKGDRFIFRSVPFFYSSGGGGFLEAKK